MTITKSGLEIFGVHVPVSIGTDVGAFALKMTVPTQN